MGRETERQRVGKEEHKEREREHTKKERQIERVEKERTKIIKAQRDKERAQKSTVKGGERE